MLSARLTRQLKLLSIRQVHSTFVKNENKPVPEAPAKTQTAKQGDPPQVENIIGAPLYNVSNFNKRILVWVKRYPSIDQVPSQLPIEVIQQAHTKARIRVCFIMMVFSMLGLFISAQIGKRDVAGGKNMYTERTKWYNEIKEKANREKQEALNAGKE